MTFAEVFQLIGGFILAAAGLPQLTQIYLTKAVAGVNLLTFFLIVLGNLMKLIYAVELAKNGITTVLFVTTMAGTLVTGTIFLLIIYYRYFYKNYGRRW